MIDLAERTDSKRKPIGVANTARRSSPLTRIVKSIRKNGTLFLMALPGLALLFVFQYMPLPGLVIAFKNYRTSLGMWGSDWIGLKNFEYLFTTDTAVRITTNTIFLNAVFIITGLLASLTIALLLNEVRSRHLGALSTSRASFSPISSRGSSSATSASPS